MKSAVLTAVAILTLHNFLEHVLGWGREEIAHNVLKDHNILCLSHIRIASFSVSHGQVPLPLAHLLLCREGHRMPPSSMSITTMI